MPEIDSSKIKLPYWEIQDDNLGILTFFRKEVHWVSWRRFLLRKDQRELWAWCFGRLCIVLES